MTIKRKREYGGTVVGVLITALIFGAIGFGVYSKVNQHWETFTVTKTERVNQGDNSKYLIYTDNGVYENTDNLLLGKFNSSDLYGDILEGERYTCNATGFRVPILSWYENLISCERWGR